MLSSFLTLKYRDFCLISKSELAFTLLCIGVMWAYWGSLMPWFLWGTVRYNAIISGFFVLLSFYVSYYFTPVKIFTRDNVAVPALVALVALLLMRIVNGDNIIGLTEAMLNALVIFSLLKLDPHHLQRLVLLVCKSMALLLAFSIPAFILYIAGFPLQSVSLMNEDMMYSYENYYLFLVDERFFFFIIPRFQSVFLEPGHLGTASVLLLFTQIGRWRRWYNVVLLVAALLSLSLAAYVLLVMVMFANAWIQHKQFFLKMLAITLLVTGVGVGAFLYDQGDNMLFTLIVERLEVDDEGNLVGDNRVTEDFKAVYDDFVTSPDLFFGRKYNNVEFGFGNSGYRVFVYDYGLICALLAVLFYVSMAAGGSNRRAAMAMLVVALATCWVRANPFGFNYLLPFFSIPIIHTQKP